MSQRLAVACMVLLITVVVPCKASSHGQNVVRFALDQHGGIIVPVLIDGKGPFRFLLDTGSSATMVSESFARRIGATAVAKAEISTPVGRTLRAVVQLSNVTVGSTAGACLLASVVPDDAVSAIAPNLDGILGQDFLAPHNYTLDYHNKTLDWGVHADREAGTRLALVWGRTQLLVELPQDGGRTLWLVPDSGAEGLVLFARNGKAPVEIDAVSGVTSLESLVGRLQVRTVSVRELKLGNLRLRNHPAVAIERGEEASQEGDGLLPLHHFHRVTFNAAGYVILQR